MRFFKKIVMLAAAAAVLVGACSVVPAAHAVVTASDGTYQYIYTGGAWQLYSYIGEETELVLPGSFGGEPVNGICGQCFANSAVTSVTIPEGYGSVGEYAFYGCAALAEISLPGSVSSVGIGAFAHSGVESADLSAAQLSVIPSYLFTGCSSLETALLPSTAVSIGEAAFAETALTEVEIPQSVTTLGYAAFANTGSLTSVSLPDGMKTIGESCFENSALSDIGLPEGLETIGASAFRGDSSLTTLYIPDSVTDIGGFAFFPMSVQSRIEVTCFEDSYAAQYCYENFVNNTVTYKKLYGDANLDGYVNINDVTFIQRCCADMQSLSRPQAVTADVTFNGDVSIEDATQIQRYLAEFFDFFSAPLDDAANQ